MTVNDRELGGPPGAAERDPRLDGLYRETGREMPPAHLDAAIRAAARREVGARPRPLPSALRKWRLAVSIAAVLVLSVSLVTLIREERGEELRPVAPSTPPAPQSRETEAPPVPQPEAAKRSASAPTAGSEPTRPALRDDKRAGAPGGLGSMADRTHRDSVSAAASGAGTAAAPETAAKPAPAPFLAAPRVAEERAAASPQAGPAMEGGSARAPAVAAQHSAGVGGTASEREDATIPARSMKSAVPGQDKAPPWQGFEKEPPQKWLDRIAELRRQGQTTAAGEMLAEFKRRFPDHPLPSDLSAR